MYEYTDILQYTYEYRCGCVCLYCRDLIDGYECDCIVGYEGKRCQTNIDECNSAPCINGKCTDEVNEYRCLCEEGYDGVNCERNIDECISSPCLNEGVLLIISTCTVYALGQG